MASEFWQKSFAGLESTPYPTLPAGDYQPVLQRCMEHDLSDSVSRDAEPWELNTQLHASWAVVLALYANTTDVVFGTSAYYLDHSSPGTDDVPPLQTICGSLFPLRVSVQWDNEIGPWMREIRDQTTAAKEFLPWGGLDKIRSCSPAAFEACDFRTLLLVRDSESQIHKRTNHLPIEGLIQGTQVALILELFRSRDPHFSLSLRAYFDDGVLDAPQVQRILFQLTHILSQLGDNTWTQHDKCIGDLDRLCEEDKNLIWKWNAAVPRENTAGVTDLFTQQVKRRTSHPAVHAWDGILSYAQLDEKSTQLALWLLEAGIAGSSGIVPVCFDKTIWTTITILAIAKAGSIFILLDPHQPRGRLRAIMGQIQSPTILARHDTAKLAQTLAPNIVVVDDYLLLSGDQIKLNGKSSIPVPISPADHLYIVFTSGSTGTPKGVTISHANLCSAVGHQARALGFDTGVRTFDSSSYSFDAYVCNTFHTLLTGGCLCVPSETARINSLQSVLQEMQVEFAQLTPSTSRLLDPKNLPRLRTLILTGEKINRTVIEPWLATAGRVRVINAYGPSECTIMCAANLNVASVKEADSIGFGLGANLWVADLHDITRLAPVGAIGELLIDGPIIGQGYLNDANKTRESLVHVPGGYLPGVAVVPTNKIFRTRDLVRYNSDGSLSFIGRADTQIKINGQRIEIGEVEYHLGQCLPDGVQSVVEVVQWPSGQKQLLAFIHHLPNQPSPQKAPSRVDSVTDSSLAKLIPALDDQLSERLPRSMIPSAYFPLQTIPMTSSGKTDRRKLRLLAQEMPHRLLDRHMVSRDGKASPRDDEKRPMTADEMALQRLWIQALNIHNISLPLSANFFSLGGDSLAAMRLVSLINREGYDGITVGDVFQHPRLSEQALLLQRRGTISVNSNEHPFEPFTLLLGPNPDPDKLASLLGHISQMCRCHVRDIEDVYPCAPIQEEMIVLAARRPQQFVTQAVVPMPLNVDMNRFREAWENVLASTPIIRTRIVDLMSMGIQQTFAQVVLKGPGFVVPWSRYSNLQECLRCERGSGMALGEPLFRVGVVDICDGIDRPLSQIQLVMTMHHALYDGWFLDLLSDCLTREYSATTEPVVQEALVPYQRFIQHLFGPDSNTRAASEFWTRYLKGVEVHQYPAASNAIYSPDATGAEMIPVSGINWAQTNGITASTIIQTAWGVVLSKQSGSCDIVFGTTLLGRQISMPNIDRVAGPTIATVPVRIVVDWEGQTPLDLLQATQAQTAEMIPFMHFGIRRIRQLSYDARRACQFRTFVVVQPSTLSRAPSKLAACIEKPFDLGTGQDDIHAFNTYIIMIDCQLTQDGVNIRASFDESVLQRHQVQCMLGDMERIIHLLTTTTGTSSRLSHMGILAAEELNEIINYRQTHRKAHFVEVASHLKEYLSAAVVDVVVDVMEIPGMSPELVAFLYPAEGNANLSQLSQILSEVMEHLVATVPLHMLPTKFLPLLSFPVNGSGETDHEMLRQIALETPPDRFLDRDLLRVTNQDHDYSPLTEPELLLQRLWATLLGLSASSISKASSFLSLGGDSLTAMRLVTLIREKGYSLTVAEILRNPCLRDMAARAIPEPLSTQSCLPSAPEPFSMLEMYIDRKILAEACHLQPWEIEDAYPCSPLQEAMMARTVRRPKDFVSRGLHNLPYDVDIDRLKWAWEQVVAATPILRSRFIETAGHGLIQVVTTAEMPWVVYNSLTEIPEPSLKLGGSLFELAAIRGRSALGSAGLGAPALLMTIHHALYDRWSASLIMDMVEAAYRGNAPTTELVPYNRFINYLVQEVDDGRCREFWTTYLADCSAPQFPILPTSKYEPTVNQVQKRIIKGAAWPNGFTPATSLKAAWALMVAQYSNCPDVVFGLTVMGRQAPLSGIEQIAGPTLATVPIRIVIDWTSTTVQDLLSNIQSMATEMIPFEHYGLGRLQGLNAAAQQACRFQSLLVIQPGENGDPEGGILGGLQVDDEDVEADTYALVLECVLHNQSSDELTVKLNYDDRVLDELQSERILAQLEHVLNLMSALTDTKSDVRLENVDLLSQHDHHELWSWNKDVPHRVEGRVDNHIAKRVAANPDAPAICAWDGEFCYGELLSMARQVAYWLVIEHGVGPEVAVPICCPKSRWTPLVMLAIIIAGGVVVMMDPFQPAERLRSVTSQVNPRLIIAATATKAIAQKLGTMPVYVVDEAFLNNLPPLNSDDNNHWIPSVSGDNALYVTFTSGSTGTPKGAVITHANACSAVAYQMSHFGYQESTRVLDLSSYGFDVVWQQFLHTLVGGGCLCIPSEEQRLNDIPSAITDLRINYLDSTPSLARTLDPSSFPNIRRVVLGGEPVRIDDVTRWGAEVEVINSYGPSECTISSTIALYGRDFDTSVNLGRPYGLNGWIASCLQPTKLAPIGAVGELVLEGPLVGRGYLHNPEKTATVFISNPTWLLQGDVNRGIPGRRGRLYRTGDLVKYDSQGRLQFVGRLDTQVKIRGQRVELEEIEYHVSRLLHPLPCNAVVEVIEVSTVGQPHQKSQRLTVFLSLSKRTPAVGGALNEMATASLPSSYELARGLAKSLPSYLVPAAFIVIEQIPMSSSGKADRRRLRELGRQYYMEQSQGDNHVIDPVNEAESFMRGLWADVLGIPADRIGRQDSFLDLGGDSLTAIRLVGAARKHNLPLSVSIVFQYSQLDRMVSILSRAAKNEPPNEHPDCKENSSSHTRVEWLPDATQVAQSLSLPQSAISDILPVTEFQRYAISCAFATPRTEWNYFAIPFQHPVDIARLREACRQLVLSLDILRSVFMSHGLEGHYVQVILRTSDPRVHVINVSGEPLKETCDRICLKDLSQPISPGSPFVGFYILHQENTGVAHLIISISHALYDGLSLALMMDQLAALYDCRPPAPKIQFSSFIEHSLCSQGRFDASCAHWQALLQDAPVPTQVIEGCNLEIRPGRRSQFSREVVFSRSLKGITVATVFAAAWGVAMARALQKEDIVFGRAVSGRSSDHGLVVGPCLNLVPVRMQFATNFASMTRATLDPLPIIQSLQSQFVSCIPHETIGLFDIVQQCTSWPDSGASFGSVFYFQNIEDTPHFHIADQEVPFVPLRLDRQDPPEPPRLDVHPHGNGKYTLQLSVHERAVGSEGIWSTILDQMEWFLGSIPTEPHTPASEKPLGIAK
ncbi:acetyl-CoA synthetase-like protein [Aspergillus costaricaensis CBS 115574]|uniref:Acetyl-CoA synthetase-like protein n=1 Tax=Aspergillus costaricaensis CBS 115574 TaxID=1448317 RepID=A0ACD1IJZ7_9EURO|nr:acetyl-CoA synthetase-like protein [Aspergillus costaricaensis CBS 115574]RAK90679.1 acetyl-CoA synthetase-like protein [Aspergillus costaricaensis CBS 115574]